MQMNVARIVGLMALISSTPVLATSPGNIVSCTTNSFDCSPTSNVVQDGAEFDLVTGFFDFVLHVDFSQDLLTVTESSSVGQIFVGSDSYLISFTNISEPFLQAPLLNSNVAGFDSGDISLFGPVLTLNFASTAWTSQSTFQIRFAEQVPERSVPEPTSWAMLLGFAAAGLVLRRRRNIGVKRAAV
jgi:PEP-CTERM motif-containing protein